MEDFYHICLSRELYQQCLSARLTDLNIHSVESARNAGLKGRLDTLSWGKISVMICPRIYEIFLLSLLGISLVMRIAVICSTCIPQSFLTDGSFGLTNLLKEVVVVVIFIPDSVHDNKHNITSK